MDQKPKPAEIEYREGVPYLRGKRICGASRGKGTRVCRRRPLSGSRRCAKCGGVVSTRMQHGRYSQALGHFAKAYRDSLRDKELLSMSEPIAAMDALVKDMMQRTASGDEPDLRKRALEMLDDATWKRGGMEPENAVRTLTALRAMLVEGIESDRRQARLFEMLERLSERQEAAQKIITARGNVVTMRELSAFVARLVAIVAEEGSRELAFKVARRAHAIVLPNGPVETPAAVSLGDAGDAS